MCILPYQRFALVYITFTKVSVDITVPKVSASVYYLHEGRCVNYVPKVCASVYYLHEGKCVYYRTKGLHCVYITFTKVGVYITIPKVCASVHYLHEGKCVYYRTKGLC